MEIVKWNKRRKLTRKKNEEEKYNTHTHTHNKNVKKWRRITSKESIIKPEYKATKEHTGNGEEKKNVKRKPDKLLTGL